MKDLREKWVEIGGRLDRVTPDSEYIATKDGEIYEVWVSDNHHITTLSTIGVVRFVFDEEGNILATQLPLFNFGDGFCLHSVESLKREAERYADYQEFCNRYES